MILKINFPEGTTKVNITLVCTIEELRKIPRELRGNITDKINKIEVQRQ